MRNSKAAKTIITLATMSIFAASPAAAATKSSKEEAIGVGSGALIGAAAGGPVGFIIGAAIGAKLGDTIDRKNDSIDSLESTLVDSRNTVAVLEGDADSQGREIERLRNVARPELVSLMQAGIAMDLLFRTDEDQLADATDGKLQQLATTLATMQDVQIRLDGFADERGDATYNQQLSVTHQSPAKVALLFS